MKAEQLLIAALLVGMIQTGWAHPGHDETTPVAYAALNAAVATPAANHQVAITIENGARFFRANGWPDHAPGQFPNRGNPHTLAAQNYQFRVTLTPQTNATPRAGQGAWFGVALNGVPFEPGTAEFWNGDREWNYEAKSGFINLGLDLHNAHVQPNGAYHYHGLPTGLIAKLGGDGQRMTLIGYAADGFPIYTSYGYSVATNAASAVRVMRSSWQLKSGERSGGPGGKYDGKFTADYEYVAGSGDLDECHGRFGVTPEYPQGIYHYYLTDTFPQLARFWRGTPDASFFKQRGPGPGGAGGRPSGRNEPRGPRGPGGLEAPRR